MPKTTYHRLKQEKKDRILTALINEYTRVPLEEVMIKNIVQEAEIPRGSFYQYFQDKEDALLYLIREHQETEISRIPPPDDLYEFMRYICRRELNALDQGGSSIRLRLLRQITLSPRASELFNQSIHDSMRSHEFFRNLWNRQPISDLTEDQQQIMMDLISSSLKEVLLESLRQGLEIDSSMERFDFRIGIIKHGLRGFLSKTERLS